MVRARVWMHSFADFRFVIGFPRPLFTDGHAGFPGKFVVEGTDLLFRGCKITGVYGISVFVLHSLPALVNPVVDQEFGLQTPLR